VTRVLAMTLTGKALVTCGVCGLGKYLPGTPDTRPCGKVRPDAEGRPELCNGHIRPDERR
jgi:hypothetical protein